MVALGALATSAAAAFGCRRRFHDRCDCGPDARRQKHIPPKYFYDEHGSRLFERITELPEYYPTRTELGILRDHAGEIARLIVPGVRRWWNSAAGRTRRRGCCSSAAASTFGSAYVPVDISPAMFCEAAGGALCARFPWPRILPVAADFTTTFRSAGDEARRDAARRLFSRARPSAISSRTMRRDFLRNARARSSDAMRGSSSASIW